MSSISGSDSDSEEEDDDSDGDWPGRDVTAPGAEDEDEDSWAQSGGPSRKSSQVAFQTPAGQYLVVHRCILQGKVRPATQDPRSIRNGCDACLLRSFKV